MSNTFHLEMAPAVDGLIRAQAIGQLETLGAMAFLDECRQQDGSECTCMRIDLSGVTVISSSGIGALVLLQEEFADKGQKIEYVRLSTEVLSVVRLMDLEGLLNIVKRDDSPAPV